MAEDHRVAHGREHDVHGLDRAADRGFQSACQIVDIFRRILQRQGAVSMDVVGELKQKGHQGQESQREKGAPMLQQGKLGHHARLRGV